MLSQHSFSFIFLSHYHLPGLLLMHTVIILLYVLWLFHETLTDGEERHISRPCVVALKLSSPFPVG